MAVQPGRGHRLKKNILSTCFSSSRCDIFDVFITLCAKEKLCHALVFVLLDQSSGFKCLKSSFLCDELQFPACVLVLVVVQVPSVFPCLFFPLSHLYASVLMSAVCLLVSMFTVFSFGLFPLLVIGGSIHVCITFLWLLPLLFTFVFFHVLCQFCFLSPSECPDCPVTLVLVFPNQPSLSMNSPVSPLSLDYTLLQTQTAGDTTVAQSFLLYFFNIHLLDTCRWCIVVQSL